MPGIPKPTAIYSHTVSLVLNAVSDGHRFGLTFIQQLFLAPSLRIEGGLSEILQVQSDILRNRRPAAAGDALSCKKEIDASFEAFQDLLPELIEKEAGRWALLRNRECVDVYDALRDAMTAGNAQFEDGMFSVQEITANLVDLGWFSRTAHWRHI